MLRRVVNVLAETVVKQTCVCRATSVQSLQKRKYTQFDMFDPPYIQIPVEVPEYDTLNIRLRGFDFAVLEQFSKYVHNLADRLDLDSNCFPVPNRSKHVVTFKPASTKLLNEYDLQKYERCIQIDDMQSTMAPILLECIQSNMPLGVEFSMERVTDEEEEFRYIPDLALMDLQSQVEELDIQKEDRKK